MTFVMLVADTDWLTAFSPRILHRVRNPQQCLLISACSVLLLHKGITHLKYQWHWNWEEHSLMYVFSYFHLKDGSSFFFYITSIFKYCWAVSFGWKPQWHWGFKTHQRQGRFVLKIHRRILPRSQFSVAMLKCVLLPKPSRFMWLRQKGKGEPALLIKVKYVGLQLLSDSLAGDWLLLPAAFSHHHQPHYHSLCIPVHWKCIIWQSPWTI